MQVTMDVGSRISQFWTWEPPSAEALSEALSRDQYGYDLWKYWTGGNVGGAAPAEKRHHSAFVKLMAFVGGDVEIFDEVELQWLRFIDGGMPAGQGGGYESQHSALWMAYALVASRTPALWQHLTSATEQRAVALTMLGCAASGAFPYSTTNPFRVAGEDGRTVMNVMIGGAYNFSGPPIWSVILATAFFEDDSTVADFFGRWSREGFVAEIDAYPGVAELVSDLREVWAQSWDATDLPEGTNAIAEDGPTASQIAEALHGYRDSRLGLPPTRGALLASVIDQLERAYPGVVAPGCIAHPEGDARNPEGLDFGVYEDGKPESRRKYVGCLYDMADADRQPLVGLLGQAQELDTKDGGGKRSSLHYCKMGLCSVVCGLTALAYVGELDQLANDPELDAAIARADVGMQDLAWKAGVRWSGSDVEPSQGYEDFSKDGRPNNPNETLLPGTEDWQAYDFVSFFSLWFDVFRPWWLRARAELYS